MSTTDVTATLFEHGEVVPARRMATPMWLRAAGYWGYQYKRTWKSSIATSFLIPILYLAAMGIALGSLIDKHSHGVGGVSYLAYLAPGLLAGTSMQIGTNDMMYPVLGAIKWMRTYLAMLAGPLSVYDVLIGHLAWVATRIAIVVSIYLAVMAAFGTIFSFWAILALPVAVLTGMAFGAPMAAFAATLDKDSGFSTLYRFVIIPLFLFSATFYPITVYPGWLQAVVRCTPLYQGVVLVRSCDLGIFYWALLLHVLYLAAMAVVGVAITRRRLGRLLLP